MHKFEPKKTKIINRNSSSLNPKNVTLALDTNCKILIIITCMVLLIMVRIIEIRKEEESIEKSFRERKKERMGAFRERKTRAK